MGLDRKYVWSTDYISSNYPTFILFEKKILN